MALNCLINGADNAPATLLMAHGAGAPMDSASMQAAAMAIATAGLRVVRFEFGYMAARRAGHRKPSPRAELLVAEYLAAVEQIPVAGHLIIGGKSMGARVLEMNSAVAKRARTTSFPISSRSCGWKTAIMT